MHSVDTPIGPLWLATRTAGSASIAFHGPAGATSDDALLHRGRGAAQRLLRRRAGALRPPAFAARHRFQRRVWDAVAAVPVRDHDHLLRGSPPPSAARARRRAVGAANGRNPLPIVVPCHRVIGASGALTGYGGGLDVKRALLALEA